MSANPQQNDLSRIDFGDFCKKFSVVSMNMCEIRHSQLQKSRECALALRLDTKPQVVVTKVNK